ncbi:MAG: zinc-binding dehydrogenase [Verrucomicrobia bacterium]|nr:zinc-binding dehydrogenase [Verrucomicrobiota bacterium]MDA1068654.1 zinc-binding dehydrogenase [Verrucomicrobiota bacterium]
MKAGRFVGPRKVELIDVPLPEMGENEVRFKIEASCLCGSDSPLFNYDFEKLKREGKQCITHYIDYEQDSIYPMPIGLSLHECVGTVTESRSSRFKVGDFVLGVPVMQRGFFEYLTLPEERIYPMPSGPVSKQEVLMSQPLGTILFGFRKLPDISGKSVVVIGQGPIGLMMNSVLRNLGARQIIGIDNLAYRTEVGRQMGATDVIDSSIEDTREKVKQLTEGAGADIVLEAAGHHELSIDLAVDLVAHDGHVMQFGVTDHTYMDHYPAGKLFYKNVSLHNSVGAYYEKDFVEASRQIASGEVDVKPLLTHTFKLDQVQKAYETYVDRSDNALKVLLDFS